MKMSMWKTLLMMWISFFTLTAFGEEPFRCGDYEISGVIRKVDGQNVLRLYDGSMSETTLSLAPDLAELAEIYLGSAVTLRGRLSEPVKNYRGTVESMLSAEEIRRLTSPDKPYTARFMREDIKERVPDPLHPDMDSGLKIIKERPCGVRGPTAAPSRKKSVKK